MWKRFLRAMALTGGAWACCGLWNLCGQSAPKGRPMQPSGTNGLALIASLRSDGGKPLLPEEAPLFDVHLRNTGTTPKTLTSIVGNLYSPTIRLFDAGGNGLGSFTPASRGQRTIGDMSTMRPPPPRQVTLAPGQQESIVVNLWAHRDAAPPGKYFFEAAHSDGEALITSNRVPFEIAPADVKAMALSYDSAQRTNSTLAWLAAAHGAKSSRLLIRVSGFVTHATAQVGATDHGEFPLDARVAVSATPLNATFPPSPGWAAVVYGDKLELIEHSLGEPEWRAPVVTLPLSTAVPVPRFPNRVHAIFLATGAGKQGPALAGAVAQEDGGAPKQWTVPLVATAAHSACLFALQGAIAVFYASDDGKTSR